MARFRPIFGAIDPREINFGFGNIISVSARVVYQRRSDAINLQPDTAIGSRRQMDWYLISHRGESRCPRNAYRHPMHADLCAFEFDRSSNAKRCPIASTNGYYRYKEDELSGCTYDLKLCSVLRNDTLSGNLFNPEVTPAELDC